MKNKFLKILLFAVFVAVLAVLLQSCKGEDKTTEPKKESATDAEISGESGTEETGGATTEEDTGLTYGETDETDLTDEITENSEDSAEDEKNKKYYSFLTGIECTRTEQRKRPVSIIINNIKPAMPNVGISHADIIYECIVEGGQTRLMMVLTDYENIQVFGSVRSSREYYIDLSRSHDTIYVHAGGNPQDYVEFSKRPIDRIDGVNMNFPNTFYRDAVRRQTMALEHTLMTSGEGIVAGIQQAKYRTKLSSDYTGPFKFYETFSDIGGINNTANYVCVPYSVSIKPEFIYNSDEKLYYRKQFGAAHIDGETGEQIKFENVVVLFAEYTPLRETEIQRKEGHLSCELTGTGYGFYVTGGKYKIIRWKKETRESALNLFNLDNSDLFLNPGKSFICVTSTEYNKSVVINADIKDAR